MRVELDVSGFECDPDEITATLGVKPTRVRRKGEPVSWADKIPADRTPPSVKANSWTLVSSSRNRTSVADHLDSLVGVIKPIAGRFSQLPPEASVYVMCVVYDANGSVVIEIPSEAAALCAKIGADIGVDYYDMSEVASG